MVTYRQELLIANSLAQARSSEGDKEEEGKTAKLPCVSKIFRWRQRGRGGKGKNGYSGAGKYRQEGVGLRL
jgi:hypothetical protein